MAKLVFGLNQSLDGYVDHRNLSPSPAVFRHFVEHVRALSGIVYGRVMYEVMRYWDEDFPDWDENERDFAAAWRSQPKWVVSRSLKSVGPNATPLRIYPEMDRFRARSGKDESVKSTRRFRMDRCRNSGH